uniref:Arginine/serine-rich coiled-coil protein 2 isoform X2 n=1 Tax=Rhizophora mucronata TaxID=61149 RepID=A0A2P2KM61_RHIMU
MDSERKSLPQDNCETKATFRKPSGDVANRNYRRHSPVTPVSSSSDGSPKCEHSSSPVYSKGNPARITEPQQRRKDTDRELDKNSGRSNNDRGGDSYRHSDRHSSRNSYGHFRHDDYGRHEKHSDDGRRHYQSSSHSGRDSRGFTCSSHAREETGYGRARDQLRNADKYLHDRYDSSGHRSRDRGKESLSIERQKYKDKDSSPDRTGSGRKHTNLISEEKDRERHGRDKDGRDDRRDYRRSSRDHKSDQTLHNDESRGYRNDSKDLHAQKGKNKREDLEINRNKDKYIKASVEENEEKFDFGHENEEPFAKKPKLSNTNEGNDCGRDVTKLYTTVADEKQPLSSKRGHDTGGKDPVEPVHADSAEAATDLNAAKVAAMKAAELVNKNLVGVGFMSTEQKKKLLWGSKKSTVSEESGHRWDTSLIGDRDRQEKFNKLMGVKGNVNVDHKADDPVQAEKQKELQMDLEKQYTAGLRRRDGRTVGLGL